MPKTTREKENWKNIFHFFRTDLRLLPGCTIFGGGTELAWSTLNPLPGVATLLRWLRMITTRIVQDFSIHILDEILVKNICDLLRNIGKNRARFWKIN